MNNPEWCKENPIEAAKALDAYEVKVGELSAHIVSLLESLDQLLEKNDVLQGDLDEVQAA